jgi:hypothetical protein
MVLAVSSTASAATDSFTQGIKAYDAGKFDDAVQLFQNAAATAPSFGAYYNLGNAQWQANHAGEAILAWEHAQWLNPLAKDPRNNLRFARRMGLLENPQLTWYEICSMWLPPDLWPWLACGTFWGALALVFLPGIFRLRRSGWLQGVAAASFALFLLTLPALFGIQTRSHLGIVLEANTPLRLTPTSEAQYVTRLAAGETARVERERGNYVYVRTSTSAGWLGRDELGIVSRN